MRISTVLMLLMVVVCSYARSFTAVDIPDPPQLIQDHNNEAESVKETTDETSNAPMTTKAPTTTKVSTQSPTTAKAPTTTKVSTQTPTTTKAPTTTNVSTQSPTTTKPPTTTKVSTQSPTTTNAPTTTTSTTKPSTTTKATTTTLDPWDEFCKEACEEGLAGPECDCPDHPIGRRSVGRPRHRRSTSTDNRETSKSESMNLKRYFTSKAKPTVNLKVKRLVFEYCKIVCDNGIDNDICKCSDDDKNPGGFENLPSYIDKDPSYNINGSVIDKGGNTTEVPNVADHTTKDPLEEFCETACSEGEGSLACNCHDHIIGRRRRRSIKNFLEYPVTSSLQALDSNRHQNFQSSSAQYSDVTHLENTFPRVSLQRDSVQSQDLNVNFSFRKSPEITKAHKEKLT
ncbi:unnamed protein product [Meganyctiphanes norvegica]|uniref:Uncharacterized protein n=1 Tax=Meganyctiphanes norvegica TaxID=48144 RepID=A0AAV2RPU7_MEGNR